MSSDRLTLLASDATDLPLVSALMQDAIVRAGDVAWDARGRRLVLLASRYRWETSNKTRVRSALRIAAVAKVQRQGWPQNADTPLVLLAVTADGDHISISFAGGTSLRAEIECIDAVLEDMSPAWNVRLKPEHG